MMIGRGVNRVANPSEACMVCGGETRVVNRKLIPCMLEAGIMSVGVFRVLNGKLILGAVEA